MESLESSSPIRTAEKFSDNIGHYWIWFVVNIFIIFCMSQASCGQCMLASASCYAQFYLFACKNSANNLKKNMEYYLELLHVYQEMQFGSHSLAIQVEFFGLCPWRKQNPQIPTPRRLLQTIFSMSLCQISINFGLEVWNGFLQD